MVGSSCFACSIIAAFCANVRLYGKICKPSVVAQRYYFFLDIAKLFLRKKRFGPLSVLGNDEAGRSILVGNGDGVGISAMPEQRGHLFSIGAICL